MIITMTALGIAAAATAAYYGPVIIASVAGAITTISGIVGGYYYAKSQQEKESAELEALREELLKREADVRRSAEQLAEQTARDVEGLLQQSKAQQEVLSQQLETLDVKTKTLELTSEGLSHTAETLISTSEELTGCVDSSRQEMDGLRAELITLKLELTNCHALLKQVSESEILLQQEVNDKEKAILELTENIEALERLIPSKAEKETINQYKQNNLRLVTELKHVKQSITELTEKYNVLSNKHQTNQQLIKGLQHENKELTQLLAELTDTPLDQSTQSPRRNQFF